MAVLRKMPPLEAAEAFLAAAGNRSFRAAAASLALSQSAFSRRVQQLERLVGVELFVRSSNHSELSAAGHAYLGDIGAAVETIRTATNTEHRLLADRVSRRIWGRWLDAAGYEGPSPPVDDHFETNQLCNEAAASGLGIALCLPMVTERFIEKGRLHACLPKRCAIGVAYQVHTLDRSPVPGGVGAIVAAWLAREAQASIKRFDNWWSAETEERAWHPLIEPEVYEKPLGLSLQA